MSNKIIFEDRSFEPVPPTSKAEPTLPEQKRSPMLEALLQKRANRLKTHEKSTPSLDITIARLLEKTNDLKGAAEYYRSVLELCSKLPAEQLTNSDREFQQEASDAATRLRAALGADQKDIKKLPV